MIAEKTSDRATDRPGYERFPLTMAHPQFKKAESIPVPGSQVYAPDGQIVRQDYRGTPERLPPVTVRNENEEEYYAAQGYEPAGNIDPAAWVRAHANAPDADYVPQKYPMWRNGELIKSAADDPEATAEDLAPRVVVKADTLTPAEATEAENLRAQMAAMQEQMAKMVEQNAALLAEKAAPPPVVETPRGPGRPRKDAQ